MTNTQNAEGKVPCPKCGTELSISASPKSFGKPVRCQKCYKREYLIKNRKAIYAKNNRYYKEHGEQVRKTYRDWYATLSREERWKRTRKYQLKAQYGITLEIYAAMLAKQNGLCAICGAPQGKRDFDVDHNHETEKVRGLLCNPCNRNLERLEKNPGWLEKAAAYLKQYEGELKCQ
jgi:hypothetical protein